MTASDWRDENAPGLPLINTGSIKLDIHGDVCGLCLTPFEEAEDLHIHSTVNAVHWKQKEER